MPSECHQHSALLYRATGACQRSGEACSSFRSMHAGRVWRGDFPPHTAVDVTYVSPHSGRGAPLRKPALRPVLEGGTADDGPRGTAHGGCAAVAKVRFDPGFAARDGEEGSPKSNPFHKPRSSVLVRAVGRDSADRALLGSGTLRSLRTVWPGVPVSQGRTGTRLATGG